MPKSNKRVAKRPRATRSTQVLDFTVSAEKVLHALGEGVLSDLQPEVIDTKRVLGAIRARQWDLLREMTRARPAQQYGSHTAYYAAAQVEQLFKKVLYPGSAVARQNTAFGTFLSDEHRNLRTNQRFLLISRMGLEAYGLRNPLYARLLGRMQRFFRRALGESPDMEAWAARCDYGPGAAVGCGGDATNLYAKLSTNTSTPAALPYLAPLIWRNHQMRNLFLHERHGVTCVDQDQFSTELASWLQTGQGWYNKIGFVDKNADTDRLTASEPALNGWAQIGLGELIADMLHRYRPFINLRDQTRNQRLAERGSVVRPNVDTLVTIDLKSASQSLTCNAVRVVCELCPGWFHAFLSVRSPLWKVMLDDGHGRKIGAEGQYQLLCSMGNGFCFPLESLFFCAAVEACLAECKGGEYAVFGDDIICPQSAALLVIEFLRFLGFRTNTDKTFVFGPFRESCGADFFNGVNVRPYVLDFWPDRPVDILKIMNGCLETAATPLYSCWWRLWNMYGSHLKPYLRPWSGPSDTGLTAPTTQFYEVNRLDVYDEALQRFRVRALRSRPVTDSSPYAVRRSANGQMLLALRGCSHKYAKQESLDNSQVVLGGLDGTPTPCLRRTTRTHTETL